MSITLRKFLSATLAGGATLALSSEVFSHLSPAHNFGAFDALAAPLLEAKEGERLITILHTNDQHSQIDPLPANDKYAGKGGVERRATLV